MQIFARGTAAFAKLAKDGKGDSKLLETYFFLFLPKTNDGNQFAKLLEMLLAQSIGGTCIV